MSACSRTPGNRRPVGVRSGIRAVPCFVHAPQAAGWALHGVSEPAHRRGTCDEQAVSVRRIGGGTPPGVPGHPPVQRRDHGAGSPDVHCVPLTLSPAANVLWWCDEFARVVDQTDQIHIDDATPACQLTEPAAHAPGRAITGTTTGDHCGPARSPHVSPDIVAVILLQLHCHARRRGGEIAISPPSMSGRFKSGRGNVDVVTLILEETGRQRRRSAGRRSRVLRTRHTLRGGGRRGGESRRGRLLFRSRKRQILCRPEQCHTHESCCDGGLRGKRRVIVPKTGGDSIGSPS
ncbi:hypothetical protein FHX42_001191 [Saccharopolyspora lacisalsi]|uniref:Uncharacterized protein n=1 Tax=Halosaccharopolyspora lacisalsi TaxID=1000566 RepID=A0A839DPE4_9PSEU|nr:hypothetical protein [Halosaccharopolyspora lacisalsi]